MPPIPIHKNDPIAPVAAKPDGVTPQTANPPPTRTTPASIPATTTSSSSPPAPQPGARPLAPTGTSQPASYSTPPAPQPGYTATHHVTETRLAGPPPQFHIPPPSDAQLAGRSTVADTQPSKPGPTTLNMGPVASQYQQEHVGGAVQPSGSGEERRSLEHPPGYAQAPDNTPYSAGGMGGGHNSGGADGTVGSAVWSALAKAGESLKEAEEAAWRAMRNK